MDAVGVREGEGGGWGSLCLEEEHGGAVLHCSVVDRVLVGQLLEAGDGCVLALVAQHRVEVDKVAGEQQHRKYPPDGADDPPRQSFRVRAGTCGDKRRDQLSAIRLLKAAVLRVGRKRFMFIMGMLRFSKSALTSQHHWL